jgi:hypothetical protein
VLLECGLYVDIRREIGRVPNRLDYAMLVPEPKRARYIADFMLKTGLLSQFNSVDLI